MRERVMRKTGSEPMWRLLRRLLQHVALSSYLRFAVTHMAGRLRSRARVCPPAPAP